MTTAPDLDVLVSDWTLLGPERELVGGKVESWNAANSVIFYGKGGDIASNRREEQELSVASLRVLQSALV